MYAAEVVWTQREYDETKGKEVSKIKTDVIGFALKEDAMRYVDDFANGMKKMETMTFRVGKVFTIEEIA